MFIIQNGLISNDKSIDIGKDRIVNLVFKSDLTFADDDKLALNIGGLVSENYAFTQNGCFRFSYVNVSPLITGLENNIDVTVTNNGTQILSDTITMYADYSSGSGESIDLSNYATKTYVNNAISAINIDDNVSKIYVDDIAKTDLITVSYNSNTNVYQYSYNGTGSLEITLTNIPTTDVITFEVWINTETAISTLIFDENYTLLNVPSELQASQNNVFVVRSYNGKILINYSYSY